MFVASNYADAYLLDCNPDDVETEAAKFKIVSITKDGDAWLVKVTGEMGQAEVYGNGYVNIKSVKADKFPTAGDNADFFQAELTVDKGSRATACPCCIGGGCGIMRIMRIVESSVYS